MLTQFSLQKRRRINSTLKEEGGGGIATCTPHGYLNFSVQGAQILLVVARHRSHLEGLLMFVWAFIKGLKSFPFGTPNNHWGSMIAPLLSQYFQLPILITQLLIRSLACMAEEELLIQWHSLLWIAFWQLLLNFFSLPHGSVTVVETHSNTSWRLLFRSKKTQQDKSTSLL